MKKLNTVLAVLLLCALSQAPQPQTTTDQSLITKGRERYLANKCDECHGANGEGGGDGPDLTSTQMNSAQISKFLENPSPDAYMKGMPNIPADHPDHQALVAYVVSLKRSQHPEAPPNQPPPAPVQKPVKSDSPVVHKLSAAEKAHILDRDFTIEKDIKHLPDTLKTAFARLARMPDLKMANPGEKYQETDVLTEPRLPDRRLIFAGISNDRYFIHYETGGWAHTFHLAVFDVSPEGKVSFLWGSTGSQGAKDLAQLRTLLSSKAFAADGADSW